MSRSSRTPTLALGLGYAGLLPQLWVLLVLIAGPEEARFSALALGYAYAALILSFVGGMWWGLSARAGRAVAGWFWLAAVVPTLVALASAVPWAIGSAWPGPSLIGLGIALLMSLAVDLQLVAAGICPAWWLRLRIPLSAGLGILTLAVAFA